MVNTSLDVEFCRQFFPPLANGWRYFENAGGSYVPEQVLAALNRFMREFQCQPGYGFGSAKGARAQITESIERLAAMINAEPDEIVIGPSTTLNIRILCDALSEDWQPGDEIVVTNQDHESNSGPWRKLARAGLVVKEWRIDRHSGELNLDDLRPLLGERTRLVAFPQVSNVVGSVNDVGSITALVHDAGAMVCVDGVAAVAHQLPDVKALDTDFYAFSLYKLFGPHLGLLYGKRERIAAAANQNHYFHAGHFPETLNPGGLNYESVASLGAIATYFDAVHAHHFPDQSGSLRERSERVFDLFARHESALMAPLLGYLKQKPGVRIIGRDGGKVSERAPTICIAVAGRSSKDIAEGLYERQIACAHGHFYGRRVVEALGEDPDDGVVRFSMAHYNTESEVRDLIDALEAVL